MPPVGGGGVVIALLALALIDWDTTYLPDDLTLPLLWAGLVALGYLLVPPSLVDTVNELLLLHGLNRALVAQGLKVMARRDGIGMAALMIEDQVWPKRCGHMAGKACIPAEEMVQKVKAALDTPGNGRVLVVDGGGSLRRALVGGNLAAAAVV